MLVYSIGMIFCVFLDHNLNTWFHHQWPSLLVLFFPASHVVIPACSPRRAMMNRCTFSAFGLTFINGARKLLLLGNHSDSLGDHFS